MHILGALQTTCFFIVIVGSSNAWADDLPKFDSGATPVEMATAIKKYAAIAKTDSKRWNAWVGKILDILQIHPANESEKADSYHALVAVSRPEELLIRRLPAPYFQNYVGNLHEEYQFSLSFQGWWERPLDPIKRALTERLTSAPEFDCDDVFIRTLEDWDKTVLEAQYERFLKTPIWGKETKTQTVLAELELPVSKDVESYEGYLEPAQWRAPLLAERVPKMRRFTISPQGFSFSLPFVLAAVRHGASKPELATHLQNMLSHIDQLVITQYPEEFLEFTEKIPSQEKPPYLASLEKSARAQISRRKNINTNLEVALASIVRDLVDSEPRILEELKTNEVIARCALCTEPIRGSYVEWEPKRKLFYHSNAECRQTGCQMLPLLPQRIRTPEGFGAFLWEMARKYPKAKISEGKLYLLMIRFKKDQEERGIVVRTGTKTGAEKQTEFGAELLHQIKSHKPKGGRESISTSQDSLATVLEQVRKTSEEDLLVDWPRANEKDYGWSLNTIDEKARLAAHLATIEATVPWIQSVKETLALESFLAPDPNVRMAAINAVGNILRPGSVIPDFLIHALEDAAPNVGEAADSAIARALQPGSVIPKALIRALENANPDVRHAAVYAIGRTLQPGSAIPDFLTHALRDKHPDVCQVAAHVIGRTLQPGSDIPKALIHALENAGANVRSEAVYAIGEALQPGSDIPAPLIHALDDEHQEVRMAAARTIGKALQPGSAIPEALIHALNDEGLFVRIAAIEGVGKALWPGSDIPDTLIQILGDSDVRVCVRAESAIARVLQPNSPAMHLIIKYFKKLKKPTSVIVNLLKKIPPQNDSDLRIVLKLYLNPNFRNSALAILEASAKKYKLPSLKKLVNILKREPEKTTNSTRVRAILLNSNWADRLPLGTTLSECIEDQMKD